MKALKIILLVLLILRILALGLLIWQRSPPAVCWPRPPFRPRRPRRSWGL